MKRVVVTSGLREADIRPPSMLSKFKELSEEEARERFGDPAQLVEVNCPACDETKKQPVFEKNGFQYNQCEMCASVYVSPRPGAAALADYYRHSRAVEYRAQRFDPETAGARRHHLLSSLASWIAQLADEAGAGGSRRFADVGTNNPLIFDEIKPLGLFDELLSISPPPLLEVACRERGADVAPNWAASKPFGAITALEKLEHQHSPEAFVRDAAEALAERGMLIFTTRTIDGFDLQLLWDKAPYIYVPEHLNLLSVEGIKRLVERCGLELLELSTPGQLDIELVRHAVEHDPSIELPRFFDYVLQKRDAQAHADLQEYLQKHRLSSHVRAAAIKKESN